MNAPAAFAAIVRVTRLFPVLLVLFAGAAPLELYDEQFVRPFGKFRGPLAVCGQEERTATAHPSGAGAPG